MELQIGTIFITVFKNKFHIALGSAPLPIQLQILGAHLMAKTCVYSKEAYKSPTKATVSTGQCAFFLYVTQHMVLIPYGHFRTVTTIQEPMTTRCGCSLWFNYIVEVFPDNREISVSVCSSMHDLPTSSQAFSSVFT